MTDFCVDVTTSLSEPGMQRDEPFAAVQRSIFTEALRFWFKLGWIGFGGTAAHIAIMHDELVQKKRWITKGTFPHALGHCTVLPGPEAQQLDMIDALGPNAVVAGHCVLTPIAPLAILKKHDVIFGDFSAIAIKTSTAIGLYDGVPTLHLNCVNSGSLWGSAKEAKPE